MSSKLSYKFSYRRRLPHIQPGGATFFVTARLAGSLPMEVIEKLHRERDRIDAELATIMDKEERAEKAYMASRRLFGKWDKALDTSEAGINHLSNPEVAELVAKSLHYRDGQVYDLITYCLMPNHLHVVFTPREEVNGEYFSLSKIMHSIKRYTASEANQILGCSGSFWQHENYDHVVRNAQELERIIKYILYNPVKANLVKDQADWKWSYSKYEM